MENPVFSTAEAILIRNVCLEYIKFVEEKFSKQASEKILEDSHEARVRKATRQATMLVVDVIKEVMNDPGTLMDHNVNFIGWFISDFMRQIPNDDDMPEVEKLILKIEQLIKKK